MAKVIRLNSGGSTTVEKVGLSLEHAKELAAHFAEVGEPPGCAWCVGLDEELPGVHVAEPTASKDA